MNWLVIWMWQRKWTSDNKRKYHVEGQTRRTESTESRVYIQMVRAVWCCSCSKLIWRRRRQWLKGRALVNTRRPQSLHLHHSSSISFIALRSKGGRSVGCLTLQAWQSASPLTTKDVPLLNRFKSNKVAVAYQRFSCYSLRLPQHCYFPTIQPSPFSLPHF